MMDPQVHSTLGPYDIKCFRFFTFDGVLIKKNVKENVQIDPDTVSFGKFYDATSLSGLVMRK